MANKPHINIMTSGHVDHGKTSLIGRLLFDTGAIREDEMRKLQKQEVDESKKTNQKLDQMLLDAVLFQSLELQG